MNEIRTGRALQLEGLQNATNKVTLGFKCDAGTKIQLAQEAQQIGMTLSEYVDTLIASRKSKTPPSLSNTSELATKIDFLQREIQNLRKKVGFYENDLLKKAFQTRQGQRLEYKNIHGEKVSKTISQIEDIYTILLDSVKLS
ncbi:hypothetical protein [Arcicella rigui]|uniref:Uncharacterized protein n=1 Tax=Arcicella rigui TaxID=797020 RepID=A0ABU5QAW1_9BACT|nr:hypothetical protein [Arcicella rigui]MEA5139961.1 hypothetical protein [Arcicella rigui]